MMIPLFLVQNIKLKLYYPDDKTANKNATIPLQIRMHCRLSHEKRALSWNSYQMQESLLIETALSLSPFPFLCFCLIMLMKMLDRQRQMQAIMESVGEELNQHAYVGYCSRTAGEGGAKVDVGRAKSTASSALAAACASARMLGGVNREWVGAVSFEETDLGTDEVVHIVVRYRMRLPFSILGVNSIPVEQVCSHRVQNGADGGYFGDSGRDGNEEEDGTVYVGKNSTHYHRLGTCHYLYNDLKAVDFGIVGELRNESGRGYSPCGTCGAGSRGTGGGGTESGSIGSADMIYVMPYDASYYLSKNRRSIIACVQAIPLSQVGYFGECFYCIEK